VDNQQKIKIKKIKQPTTTKTEEEEQLEQLLQSENWILC